MAVLFEDLKGKSAVITGSTSGIGLHFAQALAEAGVNVMMNGFGDPEEIEHNRADLEKRGIKASYHGADMTKPVEIQDLIAQSHKTFGQIDILINNAGIQKVAPIEEFPDKTWDAIIAINLSSAFHTIKHALPHMKQQGSGRIINLASVHGLVASPYKSAYVTAKHGIIGLTKTVALEVAEHNIRCNAICPGYVETPLVLGQIADTAKARGMTEEDVKKEVILAAQPTKEFVTYEQLNTAMLLLASEAGSGMNGMAMNIDGGWVAT